MPIAFSERVIRTLTSTKRLHQKAGGMTIAALLGLVLAPAAQAGLVAGCDYLTTDPTTFFNVPIGSLHFQGVPTTTLPSGCSIGPTSSFDTVVKRLNDVNTNMGTSGLQMMALDLVSTTPVFGGLPLEVTLNSSLPGLESVTGADSGGGLFKTYLDFYVDFKVGGSVVNGLVCTALDLTCLGPGGSDEIKLVSARVNSAGMVTAWVPWSATAAGISGISGTDCAALGGILVGLSECHATMGVTYDGLHFFHPPFDDVTVPEASTDSLVTLGLAGCSVAVLRRRRDSPRSP